MKNRTFSPSSPHTNMKKNDDIPPSDSLTNLLIQTQIKMNDLRDEVEWMKKAEHQKKRIIRHFQSLHENSGHTECIEERVLDMLDAIALEYGGFVMLTPLNVVENMLFGANEKMSLKGPAIEFLDSIWSTDSSENDIGLIEKDRLKGIVRSKKPRTFDLNNFNNSVNFSQMDQDVRVQLCVPVVHKQKTVAILSLNGGMYTNADLELIQNMVNYLWLEIMVEANSLSIVQRDDQEKNSKKDFEVTLHSIQGLVSGEIDTSIPNRVRMRRMLEQVANFLEDRFGGFVFFAPLNIKMNFCLSNNVESEFLDFIFSSSAGERAISLNEFANISIIKKMREGTPISLQISKSELKDFTLLNFPEMTSCYLMPIISSGTFCGILGFGSSSVDDNSSNLLEKALQTVWGTVLKESLEHYDEIYKERYAFSKFTKMPHLNLTNLPHDPFLSEKHENVTVLHLKLSNFDAMVRNVDAKILFQFLNELDERFTLLTSNLQVIKFKSAPVWVATSNPQDCGNGTMPILRLLNGLMDYMKVINQDNSVHFQIRKLFPLVLQAGISTGTVLSGLFGDLRNNPNVSCELLGDTVVLSQNLCDIANPNEIHVCETTFQKSKKQYDYERRKKIQVKGIGFVSSYIYKGPFLGQASPKSEPSPVKNNVKEFPAIKIQLSQNKSPSNSNYRQALVNSVLPNPKPS